MNRRYVLEYALSTPPDGFSIPEHLTAVNIVLVKSNRTSGTGKKKKVIGMPGFAVKENIVILSEHPLNNNKSITRKEPLLKISFFMAQLTCKNPAMRELPKLSLQLFIIINRVPKLLSLVEPYTQCNQFKKVKLFR